MRQFFVIISVLLVLGCHTAVAELTPETNELFSYEVEPEKLDIPTLPEAEFNKAVEEIYEEYSKDEILKAIDLLIASEVDEPDLGETRIFKLIKAEIYYLLGSLDSKIQFAVAKPLYQNLFYKHPGSKNEALISFRLATIMKRMGYYPEAEGFYQYLVETYPDSQYAKEARLGLAYCQFSQENFKDALILLDEIQSDQNYKPYHPYALALEANIKYRENKKKNALLLFKKAMSKGLKVEDLTAEGLFYYAETLFANDLQEEGYQLHRQLIERPDAGDYLSGALLRIADYEISKNETEKAVARYKLLFQKYPESEPGYLAAIRLGDLRARSFRTDLDEQVIKSYMAVAQSIAPNSILNVAKQRLSSYYYAGGNYKESVKFSSDLLRYNPTKQIDQLAKRTLYEAFSAYLMQTIARRQYASACELFRLYRNEILDSGLNDKLVHQIFQIHEEQLQYDTIISIANDKRIKERFMNLGRYYAGLAMMAKGEEAKGSKLMILVANNKKMPERSLAMLQLSDLQLKNGDINGTIKTLKQVLSLKPLPPAIYAETIIKMANVQMTLGEYALAEANYSKASRTINPGAGIGGVELFADSIFSLADVSYRLGKYKESKKYYMAALGGFPDDVRIPLAKLRLKKLEESAGESKSTLSPIKDRYWSEIVGKMNDQMKWSEANLSPKGSS